MGSDECFFKKKLTENYGEQQLEKTLRRPHDTQFIRQHIATGFH